MHKLYIKLEPLSMPVFLTKRAVTAQDVLHSGRSRSALRTVQNAQRLSRVEADCRAAAIPGYPLCCNTARRPHAVFENCCIVGVQPAKTRQLGTPKPTLTKALSRKILIATLRCVRFCTSDCARWQAHSWQNSYEVFIHICVAYAVVGTVHTSRRNTLQY